MDLAGRDRVGPNGYPTSAGEGMLRKNPVYWTTSTISGPSVFSGLAKHC